MSEINKIDKELIYVVGFPKSGNTWLARLLAEVTLSNIDASNSVDEADNSANRTGGYLIHKFHDSGNMLLPDGVRVVYIVRDIRDVLVSAFFFNNSFMSEDCVRIDNEKCGWFKGFFARSYFRHQIKRMNKQWCGNELTVLRNWVHGKKSNVGNWSEHIRSWSNRPQIIMVKYEDLLQDTESVMRKVLNSIYIEVSDTALKKAISNQSFDKKKSKFRNSGNKKNVQFLRSGKAEGWREYLTRDIVKNIEMRHYRVMNKYGYKLENHKGEK